MRHRADKLHNYKITKLQNSSRGYILITLLLFVALLAIFSAALAPAIAHQIQRDREEELVHRGVQYSRAVRRYYKKFGSYPTRLEELENTNNLRFLRRRYKDPITGQDFKVLHFGEVKLQFGPGIAGAAPVGTSPAGGLPQTGGASDTGNAPGTPETPAASQSGSGASSAGGMLGGPLFGVGPIVGVVSTSNKQSIREFNKYNRYNQWQFLYDPSTDRGGLLNTPAQPALQGATPLGLPVAPAPGAPNPSPNPPPPVPPEPQQP